MAYSPIWDALKKITIFLPTIYLVLGQVKQNQNISFKFQGRFLDSFLEHFNIKKSHLVAPDVGMASALSYVTNHNHEVKSLMIGDGPGALPTSEPSIMKKMVHSGFWRMMFVIAGSGALIESAKNLGNVRYVPNKFEISDYKKIAYWEGS